MPPTGAALVLGGAGAVGGLFAQLLGDTGEVLAVDIVPARSTPTLIADARMPSAALDAAVRASPVVVVALPQKPALAAIAACAPALAPGSLFVETGSVKHVVVPALTVVARERRVEALSLNPMFAPALGFAGNTVAAVDVESGPRSRRLLHSLREAGARVVTVTAAEHDRLAAVMQAATHAAVLAFGRVVAGCADPGELLRLGPPPHLTMLAMLARIVGGAPEVYWDVQAGNPEAAAARAALAGALADLDRVARAEDRRAFGEWVAAVDRWLGADGDRLRQWCAHVFAGAAQSVNQP